MNTAMYGYPYYESSDDSEVEDGDLVSNDNLSLSQLAIADG